MASKKNMILRVQTGSGMKRVEVTTSDTVNILYEKISSALDLSANGWIVCKDRTLQNEIPKQARKTLKGLQLSHGDIVYLKNYHEEDRPSSSQASQSISTESVSTDNHKSSDEIALEVSEDAIDVQLSHETGLIPRKRHPQLCKHGALGKCLNCAPYEPYDEEYLKTLNPPAKHLSFHAYLKKLKSGVSRGKYVSLEDVSCRIKPGCTEHPPWPHGICTKCQPSAVMLNRQKYRHIDNILFENPSIMDRFLNYWRNTGCQRLGYLYGKYEKHDNVPLGIRATVSAIYEPPQDSTRNKISLRDDPNEETIEKLAADLGLRRVGWILTDLIPDEQTSGQVKYLRHSNSYFLSAQETITAASLQNKYPNICKDSPLGRFGSKFATVIVSGNEEKHIHYDGWQVSNQCMALVRDECLVPTIDDPALGYVKESSSEQFVPDVFYKEKDEYKNEVTKDSRPMPIEYFLIEVPAAFPMEPIHSFVGCPAQPFPIENREQIGEAQSFDSLVSYINKITSDDSDLLHGFLDFHFLHFLATNDMIPLKYKMSELCRALRTQDQAEFQQWLECEEWKTIEHMIHAQAPSQPGGAVASSNSAEMMDTDAVTVTGWTCRHCTFINKSTLQSCEMCSLPKN